MQISDIGAAARNLADYIDLMGDHADMDVVAAQSGLISDRLREVKSDRIQEMVK